MSVYMTNHCTKFRFWLPKFLCLYETGVPLQGRRHCFQFVNLSICLSIRSCLVSWEHANSLQIFKVTKLQDILIRVLVSKIDSFLRKVVRHGYMPHCCYESFTDFLLKSTEGYLKCFNAQTLLCLHLLPPSKFPPGLDIPPYCNLACLSLQFIQNKITRSHGSVRVL